MWGRLLVSIGSTLQLLSSQETTRVHGSFWNKRLDNVLTKWMINIEMFHKGWFSLSLYATSFRDKILNPMVAADSEVGNLFTRLSSPHVCVWYRVARCNNFCLNNAWQYEICHRAHSTKLFHFIHLNSQMRVESPVAWILIRFWPF